MRYQSTPSIQEERQESTQERATRQRQERRAELTFSESDEKRWTERREKLLSERKLTAKNKDDEFKPVASIDKLNKVFYEQEKAYKKGKIDNPYAICYISAFNSAYNAGELSAWHKQQLDQFYSKDPDKEHLNGPRYRSAFDFDESALLKEFCLSEIDESGFIHFWQEDKKWFHAAFIHVDKTSTDKKVTFFQSNGVGLVFALGMDNLTNADKLPAAVNQFNLSDESVLKKFNEEYLQKEFNRSLMYISASKVRANLDSLEATSGVLDALPQRSSNIKSGKVRDRKCVVQ